MKIFISQPMNGKTIAEIDAERSAIIDACKKKYGDDVEIVDSFFKGAPHDANPIWFLGKSIECLSTADRVFFADGWNDARGCRIEHLIATEYGKKIIYD